MIRKVLNISMISLVAFWAYFVMQEYFISHSNMWQAFALFRFNFYDLLIYMFVIAIFAILVMTKQNWDKLEFSLNKVSGWKLLILIMVLATTVYSVNALHSGEFRDGGLGQALISFWGKLLFMISGLLITSTLFYSIGNSIFKLFFFESDGIRKYMYSIAFGAFVWTMIMLVIGISGFSLSFNILWPIVIVLLILGYKSSFEFLRTTIITRVPEGTKLSAGSLIIFFIILITAIINLIHLIRPIPVGWDDMSVYMNIPRLIYDSGSLIWGQNAYNWSLVMSMGFTMFGSTEITLSLSFLSGIYASFSLFSIAKRFISKHYSILLVAVFYTLPSIVFQSSRDMKVDVALLFVTLVAFEMFLDWFSRKTNEIEKTPPKKSAVKNAEHVERSITLELPEKWEIRAFVIIGLLCGFAFGIKYTAFIFIVSLAGAVAYGFWKYAGLAMTFGAAFLVVFLFKLYDFTGIVFDSNSIIFAEIAGLLLLIISTAYTAWKFREKITSGITIIAILGVSSLIAFSPWLIFNYQQTNSFTVSALLYGKYSGPSMDVNIPSKNPEASGMVPNEPLKLKEELSNEATGRNEEVKRYFGYEEGSIGYVTLPYDVVMNPTVHSEIVNIGYLLLLILPLQMAYSIYRRNKYAGLSFLTIAIIGWLFLSFISIKSMYCQQGSDQFKCVIDGLSRYNGAGIFFLIPSLTYSLVSLFAPITYIFYKMFASISGIGSILVAILLVTIPSVIFYLRHKKRKDVQLLVIFQFLYMTLWVVLGSGIFWYGMIGFVFMYLIAFANLTRGVSSNDTSVAFRVILKFGIYLWIVVAFLNIFSPLISGAGAGQISIFSANFARYKSGNEFFRDSIKSLNPAFPEIIDTVNSDRSKYVYRVGTFLNYFIAENDKRVFADNQLDTFAQIYKSSNRKNDISDKLVANNFKYIIVDLKTVSIDRTSEKTLQKKFDALMEYLKNNPRLRLIGTDRRVLVEGKKNAEGKVGFKYAFEGEVISEYSGSVAAFEIL